MRTENMKKLTDYMTTKEAAAKWNVSLRQVQRLLAKKRIKGAICYGHAYMIPKTAAKPEDLRLAKKKVMEQSVIYVPYNSILFSGSAVNSNESIGEEDYNRQKESENAYLQGNFVFSKDCFFAMAETSPYKICSATAGLVACINLGDYEGAKQITEFLHNLAGKTDDRIVKKSIELAEVTIYLGALVPQLCPEWIVQGDFTDVAQENVLFALYIRAKYFQSINDYGQVYMLTQTVLNMLGEQENGAKIRYYFRLLCAIAALQKGKKTAGERLFQAALDEGLARGWKTTFAENLIFIHELLHDRFGKGHDDFLHSIFIQGEALWKNWAAFHNYLAQENITLILTSREYIIASFAAMRVPYAKIAKEQHVSLGRLKNIIQVIYQKLGISNRDELAKYVLWNRSDN